MDKNIKNIVFDLGGVLIDLDFKSGINGLQKAGFANVKEQLLTFDREGIFPTGNHVASFQSKL